MDATQAAQMQAALEEMRQQVVRPTGENESLRAAHMGMNERNGVVIGGVGKEFR